MLTESEIIRFIDDDMSSEKKRLARVGQRYYEGDHDIRNMRLYYFNADGEVAEDKTRSNIKISHPFFTELVDQEAQYLLSGKEGFVFSDKPDLQNALDEYFNSNEQFKSELGDLLTGTISKGYEYMYAYRNEEGKTSFETADSLGVVEVRAKDTDDGCEYIIYWYVDRIEKGRKEITRIQVWDKEQTYYYVRSGKGKLEPDQSQSINPRPHMLYKKPGEDGLYYESYGLIPFFRLDNNRKQHSGLKPIKALIDDYDLMSCGLSNNLQDASEYFTVVSGFQGDNLDELIQNVKTKKVIGVDEGGALDIKTVDIPYEARKTKLELDEKNIYRFGMGFNSAQLGDGNVTNVVIRSRYALLDIKTNKLESRLREFLQKILKVVLKEINERDKTDYSLKDVYFDFEREIITNALDNATIEKTDAEKQQVEINTMLNLAGTLDQETIVQMICDILDINYEDIKAKLPVDEEANTANAIAELEKLNE